MAHIKDAVVWWNEKGRFYGAKAPEVRAFMLDSNNYSLELYSINRSSRCTPRYLFAPSDHIKL